MKRLICIVFLVSLLYVPTLYAQGTYEQYQALRSGWEEAPLASSQEKAAADSLLAFIQSNLGNASIQTFDDYMKAQPNSQEERQFYNQALELARERSNLGFLEVIKMLEDYSAISEYQEAQDQSLKPLSQSYESLMEAWMGAPSGSEAERNATHQLDQFVHRLLGNEAVTAFEEYLRLPAGSDAEKRMLEDALELAQKNGQVRPERAQEILYGYFWVKQLSGGTDTNDTGYNELRHQGQRLVRNVSLSRSVRIMPDDEEEDIETKIRLDLDNPPAISLTQPEWVVRGSIINGSRQTIYIYVGSLKLDLMLLASLYGTNEHHAVDAKLDYPPEIIDKIANREGWALLGSGQELRFEWRMASNLDGWNSHLRTLYWGPQFKEYEFPVRVLYKATPKDIALPPSKKDKVVIEVEPPLSPMLPLVWLGGLLVLVLATLINAQRRRRSVPWKKNLYNLSLNFLIMIVLTTVILFLNEYGLSQSRLLPNVALEGRISFLVMGMLIQWLGYPFFKDRIEKWATGMDDDPEPAA